SGIHMVFFPKHTLLSKCRRNECRQNSKPKNSAKHAIYLRNERTKVLGASVFTWRRTSKREGEMWRQRGFVGQSDCLLVGVTVEGFSVGRGCRTEAFFELTHEIGAIRDARFVTHF